MVVTGAFATHTTTIYDYYICPAHWKTDNIKYIAVNYNSELKYIGKIVESVFEWSFDENNQNILFSTEDVPKIVTDDLKNNIENLKGTKHKPHGRRRHSSVTSPLYRKWGFCSRTQVL